MNSTRKARSAAQRRSRRDRDSETEAPPKVGGLAFFAALLFALIFALTAPIALIAIWEPAAGEPMLYFGLAWSVGFVVAHFLVRNHFYVLSHEFKHALVSSFSGNKAKGMQIDRASGHFEYEYTKKTAGSNAFIALAPYWLPIFTVPTAILSYVFWRDQLLAVAATTGLAYGIDCSFNWRDISRHQSDLTGIRGGFVVGLLFVVTINLAFFFLIVPWVWYGPVGARMFYLALVQLAQVLLGGLTR